MEKIPSLVTLCIGTLKNYILYGDVDNDGILQCIYELPTELFDCILKQLPALALHKLQLQMPCEALNDFDADYDCLENGRKRTRCGKLNMAWKTLFYSRWPELVEHHPVNPLTRKNALECEPKYDWQQRYWETHMQNCFDAAAERAMLPSFNGCVGEIEIPGVLIKAIGYETDSVIHNYSTLHGHCQEFGSYVRFLRLQNVFCNAETCVSDLFSPQKHNVYFAIGLTTSIFKAVFHRDGYPPRLDRSIKVIDLLSSYYLHNVDSELFRKYLLVFKSKHNPTARPLNCLII